MVGRMAVQAASERERAISSQDQIQIANAILGSLHQALVKGLARS